jgi:hypothetical protein
LCWDSVLCQLAAAETAKARNVSEGCIHVQMSSFFNSDMQAYMTLGSPNFQKL